MNNNGNNNGLRNYSLDRYRNETSRTPQQQQAQQQAQQGINPMILQMLSNVEKYKNNGMNRNQNKIL